MRQCDFSDHAALYSLGLLDPSESVAFEQHLVSCPACAGEVRWSGELAVMLAETIPAQAPPAALRDRALKAAASPQSASGLRTDPPEKSTHDAHSPSQIGAPEPNLPRGVIALARAAAMNWQPTPFEGVSMVRLYEDPVRGELASLVRMTPGARYPSHHHAALEHCYVLEGDLVFEDHTLTAGDYSAGSPDHDHASATTTQGCLLFIVHNLRDQVHAQ